MRNPHFSGVVELKRSHNNVPFWVIVNPASGPGARTDPNYVRAIDRLIGAGCVVLGYITTSYSKKDAAEVGREMEKWKGFYPRVHGLFFDEMVYIDAESGVSYQAGLKAKARNAGFWPIVANPGADTPARYFAAQVADVIVIHEGGQWPGEARLKSDRYAAHPSYTRALLIHSQSVLDSKEVAVARKHARWIYVTEGVFRPNEPGYANPWDRLSKHAEELCRLLTAE
jgi:hypothetical protein